MAYDYIIIVFPSAVTGKTTSDFTFDWCKTIDNNVDVDTTDWTLDERGSGVYRIGFSELTEDIDFRLYLTATPAYAVIGQVKHTAADAEDVASISGALGGRVSVNETISKILSEMGEDQDGTGFWSRDDVLHAIDSQQRKISRLAQNIFTTSEELTVDASADEVTVDSGGNILDILGVSRVYGGATREIFNYTRSQISSYDPNWKTRSGSILRGVLHDVAGDGKVRPYPLLDNSDNSLIVEYIKIATRLTTEYVEVGDASSQLTNWKLYDVADFTLYWDLSNAGTTRTVILYDAATKLTADKIASGTLDGDGTLTLTEQNNSGVTGSVDVTFTIDDTDAANTLLLTTIEIPLPDIPCLEYAVKAALYGIERDGKDSSKAGYWNELYKEELAGVLSRAAKKRAGSVNTLQERSSDDTGLRIRPYYPWEV